MFMQFRFKVRAFRAVFSSHKFVMSTGRQESRGIFRPERKNLNPVSLPQFQLKHTYLKMLPQAHSLSQYKYISHRTLTQVFEI